LASIGRGVGEGARPSLANQMNVTL